MIESRIESVAMPSNSTKCPGWDSQSRIVPEYDLLSILSSEQDCFSSLEQARQESRHAASRRVLIKCGLVKKDPGC